MSTTVKLVMAGVVGLGVYSVYRMLTNPKPPSRPTDAPPDEPPPHPSTPGGYPSPGAISTVAVEPARLLQPLAQGNRMIRGQRYRMVFRSDMVDPTKLPFTDVRVIRLASQLPPDWPEEMRWQEEPKTWFAAGRWDGPSPWQIPQGIWHIWPTMMGTV